MTIKIYGKPGSRARRPLWVARELGIAVQNVEFIPPQTKEAEYLSINPNGKVPALVDGDLVIFESLAQSMYLAKKFGLGKLYPDDAGDEARVWQWTLWATSELEKLLVTCLFERVVKAEDVRDPQAADDAERDLQRPLKVLNGALSGKDWLIKDFSVADINVAAILALAIGAKVDLSAFPNVKSWLERATGRPAYNG